MSLNRSVTVPLGAAAIKSVSRLRIEPASSRGDRAQAYKTRVARVEPRPGSPVAEVAADQPGEERLPPPERVAPALLVPVPELDVVADSLARPARDAAQLEPERQVEPDDRVGRSDHRVAELGLVVAVDHPAVGELGHRLDHPGAELFRRRLVPVRPMVERVELDEGHAEPLGELLRERRLAGARRALDVDAPQSSSSSAACGSSSRSASVRMKSAQRGSASSSGWSSARASVTWPVAVALKIRASVRSSSCTTARSSSSGPGGPRMAR